MKIAQALALRGELDSYERQENAWLLQHILGCGVLELKISTDIRLSSAQQQAYVDGLARIEAGEPLAYVTGTQPFWTLDLKVTPDTLVPRPDTEILVERVLQLPLAADARIVDLGTGSGAIALSLASERPQWEVLATDIYAPTLAVAAENANTHGLTQVKFLCSAWYAAFDATQMAKFDLIVSNPPYIDAEDAHMQDLQAEPRRALVADQHGMADLTRIIQQGRAWLKSGGWMALEHGFQQAQAVQQVFAQAGFSQIATIADYAGNDRVSLAQYNA